MSFGRNGLFRFLVGVDFELEWQDARDGGGILIDEFTGEIDDGLRRLGG